ncbi:MAG TPA: alpha/beta fold hydrolase [Thermoanaerobaculia bacterium]|nr:alpha/beta fold hydrolase [Thermoanaerobaculia bacterium]
MKIFAWMVGLFLAVGLWAEPPAVGIWRGTLEVPGSSLELVVKIAGDLSGKLDIPGKWLADLPLDGVMAEGNRLRFELKADGSVFEGRVEGGRVVGEWRQAGLVIPLALERLEKAPEPRLRPQTPRPPFPYRVEEVVIERPGVRLVGTLTLPAGTGPFPAAVLLSVAGANDRDQTHSGHKPFFVLADFLARRGFAILRLDDRGVGGSTGDLLQSTYPDLAEDAWAAAEALRRRPEIDPRRVGLIGNSEGTAIAALAASRHPEVAFVMMLGGLGLSGTELIEAQAARLARIQGYSEEEIRQGLDRMGRLFRILLEETDDAKAAERIRALMREPGGRPLPLAANLAAPGDPEAWIRVYLSPWYRSQLRNDPREALQNVRCPVLALTGSLDPVAPAAAHLPAILTALLAGGNPDVTVSELPGINHLFQTARTGLPAEYGLLEESFSPRALVEIGAWLAVRFPPG